MTCRICKRSGILDCGVCQSCQYEAFRSLPDDFTRQHLGAWLDRYTEDTRGAVRACIVLAIDNDPESVSRGRSWPELRDAGRALIES